MFAAANNGDARITRSIVVEARIAPVYNLMYLDAVELIKFEADYVRYVTGATEEAGSVRTKVSCFNERLLKYLARFKIPGKPAWSDITDEECRMLSVRRYWKRTHGEETPGKLNKWQRMF